MRTTKSARPGSVVYVPMDKSEFRSIIFSEKKKNKIKKIVILIILMIFVIGCCIYAGMCIKSAYDRSDRAALKDISQNVIPGIICNLTDMKSSREKIWMNDAKPFGYEILDIKIGGVITRLKSTGYRIDNYLNGNVLRLEELEEERLPYFTKGMDKRENLWNRIISGCDLNDTI